MSFELGKAYVVYGDEAIYDGEVGALLYFRSVKQLGTVHKLYPQDVAANVTDVPAPKTKG